MNKNYCNQRRLQPFSDLFIGCIVNLRIIFGLTISANSAASILSCKKFPALTLIHNYFDFKKRFYSPAFTDYDKLCF